MGKELLERKDVDERYTWDLSSIFESEEQFEQKLQEVVKLSKEIEKEYKGKLKGGAKEINACLDQFKVLLEIGGFIGNLFLSISSSRSEGYGKSN